MAVIRNITATAAVKGVTEFSLTEFTIFFSSSNAAKCSSEMFRLLLIADSVSRVEKQVLGDKGPGGGAGGGHKRCGVGHQAAAEIGQQGRRLSWSRPRQT